METSISGFKLLPFVALLLALLWTGCGRGASDSSDREQGRPGVSLTALVEAGTKPSPETDSLRVLDRLKPPLRIETEPQKNRHVPGQVDTLRTYVYRGLEFTVYDVAHDPKVMMQNLTVADSTYETEDGLRVGLSREHVRALLGTPDQVESDTLTYRLGAPAPNHLQVSLRNDCVTRLKWSFYVD